MPKDYELPERTQDNEWLHIVRSMNQHWGREGARLIRELKRKATRPDDDGRPAD